MSTEYKPFKIFNLICKTKLHSIKFWWRVEAILFIKSLSWLFSCQFNEPRFFRNWTESVKLSQVTRTKIITNVKKITNVFRSLSKKALCLYVSKGCLWKYFIYLIQSFFFKNIAYWFKLRKIIKVARNKLVTEEKRSCFRCCWLLKYNFIQNSWYIQTFINNFNILKYYLKASEYNGLASRYFFHLPACCTNVFYFLETITYRNIPDVRKFSISILIIVLKGTRSIIFATSIATKNIINICK